jgi:hypothetical protein
MNPLELLNTPVVTGLPMPLMSLKNIPIEGFEKAKFVSFAVKLIVATLSTQLPDAVTFTSCADAVPDTSAWKPTAAVTIRNRPAVFLNIASPPFKFIRWLLARFKRVWGGTSSVTSAREARRYNLRIEQTRGK